MSEGQQDQLAGFVAGFFLGAVVGATAALLTAPQSGRRTRRRIGRAAVGTRRRIEKATGEIRKSTGDRWEELADDLKERVDGAVAGARKRLGAS